MKRIVFLAVPVALSVAAPAFCLSVLTAIVSPDAPTTLEAESVSQTLPQASARGLSFDTYLAPAGWADSWGEPSVGVDWTTERSFDGVPNGGTVLTFGGGESRYILRITFDDSTKPARALWEKSAPLTLAALRPRPGGDPILYTDRDTGRTLVDQLVALTPFNTVEITDDNGASFTPSEGNGVFLASIDHETFGGGPFAPGMMSPVGYPNAVYYCAQASLYAVCSLSVDGGLSFLPAVPIATRADCVGIHGHVKVGPDGTAYVPIKACGGSNAWYHDDGRQAVVVSEDNGVTWDLRLVTTSTVVPQPLTDISNEYASWDPSVAVASDGTVYFGYEAADGHPHVAVSHDRGHTWTNDSDVGVALGIERGVFPAMVAGDGDRAALAFFGTTTPGEDHDQPTFPGVWYLYIAATYDGGRSWSIVNATPGDPIQRGGICKQGDCRNLLDFFDASVDKQGRVVVGYEDGCVDSCVADSEFRPTYFLARGAIARQSAGRRMFATKDS